MTTELGMSAEIGVSSTPQRPPAGNDLRSSIRAKAYVLRTLVLGGGLVGWQWLPRVPGITNHINWMDPFFISSPSLIAKRVWQVCTGSGDTELIWQPLLFTVYTALLGTMIAVVLGSFAGLVLSNSDLLDRAFRPIVAAVNSVPRIAIVPIVVLVAQSAAAADIITAVAVVIGLVFYSALEGGRTVSQEMVDSARLMGCKRRDVIMRIRLPYVVAWVFANMPNAFAFGLVGAVTTELFTGAPGIGHLLQVSTDTADATLTFTVVFLLTVVGLVLVQGTGYLRQRLLPWWNA